MTPSQQGYHPCPTCGVLAPVDRPHPATFCDRNRVAWLKDGWLWSKDGSKGSVSPGWVDRRVWPEIEDAAFDLTRHYQGLMQMKDWQPMAFNECHCSAEPAPHCARCCAEGTESRTRCASLAALWGGT